MVKLTIFYDGACHLCSHEINHYKKIDTENKLHFVDIALSDFNADEYSLNPKEVQKYFHVRDKEHNIHSGVKSFYLIWKELNTFSILQKLYEMKPSRGIMNIGYTVFAEIRPYLPKKKYCENGTCYR